ncbi:hypothetical protein Tco_1497912 [Tanacetum coccineum]
MQKYSFVDIVGGVNKNHQEPSNCFSLICLGHHAVPNGPLEFCSVGNVATATLYALLDGLRFCERDGSPIRDVGQRTPSTLGYPITTATSINRVGTSGAFASSGRICHTGLYM